LGYGRSVPAGGERAHFDDTQRSSIRCVGETAPDSPEEILASWVTVSMVWQHVGMFQQSVGRLTPTQSTKTTIVVDPFHAVLSNITVDQMVDLFPPPWKPNLLRNQRIWKSIRETGCSCSETRSAARDVQHMCLRREVRNERDPHHDQRPDGCGIAGLILTRGRMVAGLHHAIWRPVHPNQKAAENETVSVIAASASAQVRGPHDGSESGQPTTQRRSRTRGRGLKPDGTAYSVQFAKLNFVGR
jgi:hypothetical protein